MCLCGCPAVNHVVDIFGTPLSLPRPLSALAVPCLSCDCPDYQEDAAGVPYTDDYNSAERFGNPSDHPPQEEEA